MLCVPDPCLSPRPSSNWSLHRPSPWRSWSHLPGLFQNIPPTFPSVISEEYLLFPYTSRNPSIYLTMLNMQFLRNSQITVPLKRGSITLLLFFKFLSITGLFFVQEDTDTVRRYITSKTLECLYPAENLASLRLAACSAAQRGWTAQQFSCRTLCSRRLLWLQIVQLTLTCKGYLC